MAVSYVNAASGNSGSATSSSFVTSLPAGWAAGDVAVLVGHVSGSALTMSTPAGWTLLAGPTWPVQEGSASRLYAWSRILQGGDTAPTITNSGSVTGGWECTAWRDASGVAQAATSTASGTAVTLPTLSGVGAGSALVVGVHCRVASGTIPTAITHDAAYTEVVDAATSRATSAANVRMGAAYRLIGSAGTYGGEQITSDVTGSMVGLLVEVAVVSTVGGTATATAAAALSATGTVLVPAVADLAAAGVVGATAGVQVPGAATVAEVGTLGGTPIVLVPAGAALAADEALLAVAVVRVPGVATLTATAALTAAPTLSVPDVKASSAASVTGPAGTAAVTARRTTRSEVTSHG